MHVRTHTHKHAPTDVCARVHAHIYQVKTRKESRTETTVWVSESPSREGEGFDSLTALKDDSDNFTLFLTLLPIFDFRPI